MFASTAFFGFTFLLFLLSSGVDAHGYVQEVAIGGNTYPGWDPNIDPYASPAVSRVIRKIPNDGPVLDIHDASLACNVGGEQGAGLVAEAEAGSQVKFTMIRWPDDHLGPVSHYMASCNGDCKQFDTSDAQWFKVDEAGYDNGVWASTTLIKDNLSSTMTIPAALKPGEYLIRHEIVALHDANQPQYYPSCAQVKVTGSGTQTPPSSDLVKIPGVYDSFKWPDIWSDSFHSFTIPGPKVAFSNSGSGTNNAAPEPPAASPSKASPSTAASSSHIPTASHSGAVSSATPSSSPVFPPSSAPTGKCHSRMVKRRKSAQRSVQGHAALNVRRQH